jgi:hypothetical protein
MKNHKRRHLFSISKQSRVQGNWENKLAELLPDGRSLGLMGSLRPKDIYVSKLAWGFLVQN